jgi:hypothetical protein
MSMPRLSFEEPKGGPLAKAAQAREAQEPAGAGHLADLFVEEPVEGGKHRRPHRRDTVLVVLRAATVAVAIALVGAVILLTTSGADDGTRAPALPEISDSNEPHTGPTTTTPPAAFVAATSRRPLRGSSSCASGTSATLLVPTRSRNVSSRSCVTDDAETTNLSGVRCFDRSRPIRSVTGQVRNATK